MRSINTSSLVRRALAVSLGLALGATSAYAGEVTNPDFNSGDQLQASHLNNIKDAVNDNDTRITTNTNAITTLNTTVSDHTTSINTLTTDVNNLKQNIATGSCGTGMTRVGPTCVDSTRSGPGTYLQAVAACRNAGKRLLTPGEYMAAKTMTGGPSDMTDLEYVDSLFSNVADSGAGVNAPTSGSPAYVTSVTVTFPSSNNAGRLRVGYMGPGPSGTTVPSNEIFAGLNADYDESYGIYYRCAR